MPQIKSSVDQARVPFAQMTFSPDIPSAALGANEYNAGQNIETDIRGIRSVAGDQSILESVPGTPIYVTSGFRRRDEYWFIVATEEGSWYATNGQIYPPNTSMWYDITPSTGPFTGYLQSTNITEAWNGNVLIVNDTLNPPMFFPDEDPTVDPTVTLVPYSNQVPITIENIVDIGGNQKVLDFEVSQFVFPFQPGDKVQLTGVTPPSYNGIYEVFACTDNDVTILCDVTDAYSFGGQVAPQYVWNYNPNWGRLTAEFLRMYNTPNVGSILVAGNLKVYNNVYFEASTNAGSDEIFTPFADDAMLGGVVYSDTEFFAANVIAVTPGVSIQLDQVAANSVTESFQVTNGVADEFPVTVRWSQNFALNTVPLTWEPTVTNVANELEVPLRGPAIDAFPSGGQFYVQSYWDTVVFSPINFTTTATPILGVKLLNQGRGQLTGNCWAVADGLVYGLDARDFWVFDGNQFKGLGNQRVKNWFFDQVDPAYYNRIFMEVNTSKNQVEIFYPDSDATNGVPNKMLSYRYDLDCWNPPRDVTMASFATESPIWLNKAVSPAPDDWEPELSSRTIVYVRGESGEALVQKDQGYAWANGDPIFSGFRRDNIRLTRDYSNKLMVHRILPEAVNLGAEPFTDSNKKEIIPSPGSLDITVEGALSIGSLPVMKTPLTVNLDTDNPWVQINQNSYRVVSIELSNTSSTNVWCLTAVNWQFTQVEDDR